MRKAESRIGLDESGRGFSGAGTMGGMERTGRRTAVSFAVVTVLLLLPILYALSSGPLLWLTVNRRFPAWLWNTVYRPLTFCRDVVPGFHELFQAYLDWWT